MSRRRIERCRYGLLQIHLSDFSVRLLHPYIPGRLNSLIINNDGGGYDGGGILGVAGTVVSNCVICGNKAATGGGINGSCDVYHSIVSNNTATAGGGGVYNQSGAVVNCLICGNKGGGAGIGVYQDGSGSLVNLTVAGNITNADEVAAACFLNGKPTVKNCIVWGNEGVTQQLSDAPSGSSTGCNLTEDPLFVDAVAGDCHL